MGQVGQVVLFPHHAREISLTKHLQGAGRPRTLCKEHQSGHDSQFLTYSRPCGRRLAVAQLGARVPPPNQNNRKSKGAAAGCEGVRSNVEACAKPKATTSIEQGLNKWLKCDARIAILQVDTARLSALPAMAHAWNVLGFLILLGHRNAAPAWRARIPAANGPGWAHLRRIHLKTNDQRKHVTRICMIWLLIRPQVNRSKHTRHSCAAQRPKMLCKDR